MPSWKWISGCVCLFLKGSSVDALELGYNCRKKLCNLDILEVIYGGYYEWFPVELVGE
jgi:hypothetical protein